MDLELIGNENLPNVYIDTIRVNSNDTGKTISVTLSMYDHVQEIGRSWYRNDIDLKIKLCLVQNPAKISKLINGVDTLYLEDNLVQITNLSRLDFAISPYSQTADKFSVTIPFNEIPNESIDTLSVFCSCYIDELGFENDLFNQYYGPLTGEKIFASGQLSVESGYFYDPLTNEEYGGPVHEHDGGFMVGSQHTNVPHSSLIYVREPNYKISEVQTQTLATQVLQDLGDIEL